MLDVVVVSSPEARGVENGLDPCCVGRHLGCVALECLLRDVDVLCKGLRKNSLILLGAVVFVVVCKPLYNCFGVSNEYIVLAFS